MFDTDTTKNQLISNFSPTWHLKKKKKKNKSFAPVTTTTTTTETIGELTGDG
jgi:hypothetical protein